MPSSGGVPPRRASWLEDSLHTPRNHGKYKSDPDGAMDAIATYFAS